MIDFLRSVIRQLGFDVVRYVPEFNRPFDVLSLVIREYLASGRPFYFVQVGANDGVVDDPIRNLVLTRNLNGLLIEPIPDVFTRLRENYSGQEGLTFENVAISDARGQATIYRFDPSRVPQGEQTSHHWIGIASFNKHHLLGESIPERYIEACLVETLPLPELLNEHGISEFTLLQVDTEGYDYEIIRSAIEAGYRPQFINYEHCWLPPSRRLQCKQMLADHDYRFLEIGKDTLAVRESE